MNTDVALTLARQHHEAARCILSCALCGNGAAATVLAAVQPEEMPYPFGLVLASVKRLHDAGLSCEPDAIAADLRAEGDLDAIGGIRVIGDLIDQDVREERLGLYVARLRDTRAEQERLEGAVDAVTSAGGSVEIESPESLESVLRRLALDAAKCDPIQRVMFREKAITEIKSMGASSPARIVDAVLYKKHERPAQGKALPLADPEAWPEQVDGALLLNDLLDVFRRFLVLPPGAAVGFALWVLHAHAFDCFSVSPFLAFKSPTKRSGKTRALTLASALVPRPVMASSVTAAVLFRIIESHRPTLLIDEFDALYKHDEALRGVLNSGHAKAGASVLRTVGDNFEPRAFSTWAPKVLAGIGDLPETIADRAVVVCMKRRAPGEKIERLRLDRLGELESLRQRAARWALDNADALRSADPEIPAGLSDRAADNWLPLLAVADLCGGAWPEDARLAAQRLSGADDEPGVNLRVKLLADVREVFGAQKADSVASEALVAALVAMPERPWAGDRDEKPLTAVRLAGLLRGFDIRPGQVWTGTNVRGYKAEDFADAWKRYL